MSFAMNVDRHLNCRAPQLAVLGDNRSRQKWSLCVAQAFSIPISMGVGANDMDK